MIKVENIHKAYGKNIILNGASFFAKPGECIGIVGANGCGKSTLLGILSGAHRPDSGEITIFEKNPLKDSSVFSSMIGYVPQNNPLMDHLSVYDNLRFWYCDSSKDLKEDLKTGVPAMFGLARYKNYDVSKLSGGMQKRLSIACSLAKDPPILILDEPGASLDLICKEDIKNYLRTFLNNMGIVIITSHEDGELALCDRMYLINNGQLHELQGKPSTAQLMQHMRNNAVVSTDVIS